MSKKSAFSVTEATQSLGLLLWQTTTVWQRLIKKGLETHDIAHAQFVIMALLCWFHENKIVPTQVAIAEWSKLDKMTISKSLKQLITRQLVFRCEYKEDTRAKIVSLTEKGQELIHKLINIVEGIDDSFFQALNKDEQKIFLRLLSKILKN